MRGSLAAVGFLGASIAWLMGSSVWWSMGGITLGAVIPFTLFVIYPTDKQLLNSSPDKSSEQASKLLRRRGWLRAVRSIFGLISLLTFTFSPGHVALRWL